MPLKYLRINLQNLSHDILLVVRVLEHDGQDGDAELFEHVQRRQEIVDAVNILKAGVNVTTNHFGDFSYFMAKIGNCSWKAVLSFLVFTFANNYPRARQSDE
jgi:hypothetical protein